MPDSSKATQPMILTEEVAGWKATAVASSSHSAAERGCVVSTSRSSSASAGPSCVVRCCGWRFAHSRAPQHENRCAVALLAAALWLIGCGQAPSPCADRPQLGSASGSAAGGGASNAAPAHPA